MKDERADFGAPQLHSVEVVFVETKERACTSKGAAAPYALLELVVSLVVLQNNKLGICIVVALTSFWHRSISFAIQDNLICSVRLDKVHL